jgi:hypothetical protein
LGRLFHIWFQFHFPHRGAIGMCVLPLKADMCGATAHVRFGSLADICGAKGHARFAPNSDRKSGFPQTVMSALPPKADMCSALAHVCFGPKADINSSTAS